MSVIAPGKVYNCKLLAQSRRIDEVFKAVAEVIACNEKNAIVMLVRPIIYTSNGAGYFSELEFNLFDPKDSLFIKKLDEQALYCYHAPNLSLTTYVEQCDEATVQTLN